MHSFDLYVGLAIDFDLFRVLICLNLFVFKSRPKGVVVSGALVNFSTGPALRKNETWKRKWLVFRKLEVIKRITTQICW